jgi:ThiF family
MSQKLVTRNPDLSRLQSDGYHVQLIANSHLLLRDVPYLTADKAVKRGILVSELDLSGETTVAPRNHAAFFIGECPYDASGNKLSGTSEVNHAVGKDLIAHFQISKKPTTHAYADFHEKMTTYVDILLSQVHAVDPAATAKTRPVVKYEDGESVFKYPDTASTKAGIYTANAKLEYHKIAIVGLGGTGSYVLDFVAKTCVAEIHLFDHDEYLNHNAFRTPGAVSLDELSKKPAKVNYLHELYSKMRWGIIGHDQYLDETNVELLKGMMFVFLCIDKGKAKKMIVERLEEWNIAFVDVGLGVQLVDDSLVGMLTVTTSTPNKRDHFRSRVSLADRELDNDYSRNVQIAELNALNAALAVIKWKKLFGYYHDQIHEHFNSYTIDCNLFLSEDTT